MTLEELQREYAAEVIGAKWLEFVRDVCQQVVTSYPPRVYADTQNWDDSLDDLTQDVVALSLLRDRQVDYLMTEGRTLADVRRLLVRQIQHVLARRRTRTVIDQLLERSRPLLSQDPFVTIGEGRSIRWSHVNRTYEDRSPYQSEFRRAEIGVRIIPIVPYGGSERAPIVYREDNLKRLLEVVSQTLATPFGIRDLDFIFRHVLTGFLPGVLMGVERPQGRSTSPEDALEMRQTAISIIDRLDQEQMSVLAAKLTGISDSDVAKGLSLSRPTAAKRKDEVFEIVRREADALTDAARSEMVDQLASLLAGEWPPAGGDQ